MRTIVLCILTFFIDSVLAELPQSVRIDQKQALILKALENKSKIDCASVIENTNELEQLNGKLTSPVLYYYRADCSYKANQLAPAYSDIEKYFEENKMKDDVYNKALLLHHDIHEAIKHQIKLMTPLVNHGVASQKELNELKQLVEK